MTRTQVLLNPSLREQLLKRSQETGAPITEIVRRAIASYLGSAAKSRPRKDKAGSMMGSIDVARKRRTEPHDR